MAFSLSVAWEVIARVRGLRLAPRLPGVGGFQRLAAYLVTTATLVVGVPAAVTAESAVPPVVATAPHHPLDHGEKKRVYRVQPGDTLWEIADERLGSPRLWRRIWKLNAHSSQPGGRTFSDPDLIRPGWKLILAPKKIARPSQESAHPALQETSAPQPPPAAVREDRKSEAIELPKGSLVALAYAAGIGTAVAANRLRRRRLRALPSAADPAAIALEPEPEPVIHELREAYRSILTEPPSETELLREAYSIEVPARTAIGRRGDGSSVDIDLAGPGLGMQGDGTLDVARYLAVDLLRQSSNFRAEIIISAHIAEPLFATPHEVPGLAVTATAEEALERFNETHFSRSRMLLEREAATIEELRERDPGEVLPTVLLITDLNDEVYEWITAPLTSANRTGVGALILGDWPNGTTCLIDEDHHVKRAEGRLGEQIEAAELFHITLEEAESALRQLLPSPDPRPEPQPSSPAWHGPQLVWLSMLGAPTVTVLGRPEPLELSWLQLSLLVYLAIHRDGVTRDQLTTALWPDESGKDVHNALRHLRNALVTATGYVNPDSKKAPFINASTTKDSATYRIDPQLVSIDLWDYQEALEQARAEPEALARAAALCHGELAHGLETEWIEDYRYPLTRSQADVLSQFADQCAADDPECALNALERARCLDPDTEELYLRIVRLQLRLGRRDDARRSAELLRKRLHGLGLVISTRTERLLIDAFARDMSE